MTRMHAGRMIAAEVVENVNHGTQIEPPKSERQARPLAKLPAAEQPAAWQAATDTRRGLCNNSASTVWHRQILKRNQTPWNTIDRGKSVMTIVMTATP